MIKIQVGISNYIFGVFGERTLHYYSPRYPNGYKHMKWCGASAPTFYD